MEVTVRAGKRRLTHLGVDGGAGDAGVGRPSRSEAIERAVGHLAPAHGPPHPDVGLGVADRPGSLQRIISGDSPCVAHSPSSSPPH